MFPSDAIDPKSSLFVVRSVAKVDKIGVLQTQTEQQAISPDGPITSEQNSQRVLTHSEAPYGSHAFIWTVFDPLHSLRIHVLQYHSQVPSH